MEELDVEFRPELRDPVAVIAFSGWNDAASAATNAARFVVSRLGAKRFATLPADKFFDFRADRPTVKIKPSGERPITWPALEFFSAKGANSDLVIGLGTEPSLKWSKYSRNVAELLADMGARLTITLGALLADAPHTRPVRVTGSAPDTATATALGLVTSTYEGPTGIVGVLNEALRVRGMQSASIWANCPHYVSTNQNPPATAALLEKLSTLIDMRFDVSDLKRAGERFVREVNAAVAANPEVADYVRGLETAFDEAPDMGDLPAPIVSEELFGDIERFLRDGDPEKDV